jgi:hypothetical protein
MLHDELTSRAIRANRGELRYPLFCISAHPEISTYSSIAVMELPRSLSLPSSLSLLRLNGTPCVAKISPTCSRRSPVPDRNAPYARLIASLSLVGKMRLIPQFP